MKLSSNNFRGGISPLKIILLFWLFSVEVNAQVNDKVEIIDLDPKTAKETQWSDLAQDYSIIQLENPKGVIVGNAMKVRMGNDQIFLMNFFSRTLHVFAMDGSYMYSLAGQGRGPGEFNRLNDFDILVESKELIIYDDLDFKVLHYNMETGEFIRQQTLPHRFSNYIAYMPEGYVLFERYQDDSPYQSKIILTNPEFGNERRELKSRVDLLGDAYSPNFFNKVGNRVNFTFGQNDTIYSASVKEGVSADYFVDFGKYRVGKSYYEALTHIHAIDLLTNSTSAGKKGNLNITDDYVGFSYAKYNRKKENAYWQYALYSKNENRVVHNLRGINLGMKDATLPYPYFSHGSKLVILADFYSIFGENEEMLDDESKRGNSEGYGPIGSMSEMLDKVKQDDNPFLILFTPKSR